MQILPLINEKLYPKLSLDMKIKTYKPYTYLKDNLYQEYETLETYPL